MAVTRLEEGDNATRSEAVVVAERCGDGRAMVWTVALTITAPGEDGHISSDRVRELVRAPERWEPVAVALAGGTVLDGRHRVLAARELGIECLAAQLFEGGPVEALVEYLHWCARIGRTLSRPERQRIARQLLRAHPEWSDRRIAQLCGSTSKTVAQVRARVVDTFGCSQPPVEVRVGRDGRMRPVDPRAKRAAILEALRESPHASLRTIARQVGTSPETVRSVKASAETSTSASRPSAAVECAGLLMPAAPAVEWQADEAFRSRSDGAATAQFLERTDIEDADPGSHAVAVPLSRVYEVADEARRRAAFWSALAECVENRVRRPQR